MSCRLLSTWAASRFRLLQAAWVAAAWMNCTSDDIHTAGGRNSITAPDHDRNGVEKYSRSIFKTLTAFLADGPRSLLLPTASERPDKNRHKAFKTNTSSWCTPSAPEPANDSCCKESARPCKVEPGRRDT